MSDFATLNDITTLFRPLSASEQTRASALLPVVSDMLRNEAIKVGKNLDAMIVDTPVLANVAKSVTVDIVSRTLLTSTEDEPMTQMSQSAMGYSVSGSYLSPGGGIFIKRSELARLGLKRQQIGGIELYNCPQNGVVE